MKYFCALLSLVFLTNPHSFGQGYNRWLYPAPAEQAAPPIILNHDTTVCSGTPVKFSTAGGALDYAWTPATFLDDPTSPSPTATPTRSIKYYVNALVTGENAIVNGDFSAGNTSFASDYNYANPNITEGQYFVGPSPRAWNSSLSSCGDHTTGTGNIMLINGAPAADVEVWKEVINVTPNTNYAFSTWLEALYTPNPAILSFSINGVDIGSLLTASLPTCTWSQFYVTWNSGSYTTATISIVNKNTATFGNDFALDDISFAPYKKILDSVTISVDDVSVKATNDTAICAGAAVQLSVGGAVSYSWTPATGLSSTSSATPVAVPSASISYVVTGSSAIGCTSKDTVDITVHGKPVVQVSNDVEVCRDAQVHLNASGGVAYQWSPALGLSNPDVPDPVATVTGNIMYSVAVTDANTCAGTDSVLISMRPYPNFSASPDVATCEGTPVTLSASGGNIYVWSPAGDLTSPNSATTAATPHVTTLYTVRIEDTVCRFDSTIGRTVTVNPLPALTIKKSNDINCTNPTASLTATGAEKYLWSPASDLDRGDGPAVTASPENTTTFTVQGVTGSGCSAMSSVIVNVEKSGVARFAVPNAFTPNGDGKNDCFGIRRWGNVVIRQFSIYNRWGQLIFQTNDPSACWDGTFRGKPQDSGNFVYVIKAVTLCGVITRKGSLLLIR